MGNRIFFIGDVHGCQEELIELLNLMHLNDSDQVILLGDLINRGPSCAQVLNTVYERDFTVIQGNHEADYIKFYDTEPRYQELQKQIHPKINEWILTLPVYLDNDQFIAVHAGLEPGIHPSQSKKEILQNIRTWDGKGLNLKDPTNPPWYDFYTAIKPVIYGHWAKQGLTIRKNTFGLDSGCVYGNYLTAFELFSQTLIQVKAKRIYQNTGLLF